MKATYFRTAEELRQWFDQHHTTAAELLLGYYKKDSNMQSVTWPESVEQALCFGWIDGIRRSIDEHRYCIRFTPRREGSIWSKVNIDLCERLIREGKMQPMGLAAFGKRKAEKSKVYSFEQEVPVTFTPAYLKKFKANKKAWTQFEAMAPYYRKAAVHWVMSAKQEATRERRLETLIADSEAGQKIKQMTYGKNK